MSLPRRGFWYEPHTPWKFKQDVLISIFFENLAFKTPFSLAGLEVNFLVCLQSYATKTFSTNQLVDH